ncbi:MAG: KR domain-containing protein [Clostridia bacterium]|nr:KR domain-containing protein [Clostridia bacterium]
MSKVFSKSKVDIAIIGIHGRFPQAETRKQFWMNLCEGRNCIEGIPEERWHGIFGENTGPSDPSIKKWGGFIKDIDKFDPGLFRISPKEAAEMDPQQRLFLESVWTAMEDAGYGNHRKESAGRVGLFVGAMWHEYSLHSHTYSYMQNKYGGPGSLMWAIANRTSFIMNFKGPSIAVDTACSSSAVAVHMACRSLLSDECDMAVAGGINLNTHLRKFDYLSHENLLASGPKKSCFQPGSEGYLPGEGVGSLLLKPLQKAVNDGDKIYAVIRGSHTNHNGSGMFFRTPDSEAQCRLLCDAYKKSGIDPRTISYIEMSAFGSEMVDITELAGLSKAFRQFTGDKQFCTLGTLKPNIGHLEAASGIAQIIKVLLQLQHRKLLPSRFCDPVPEDLFLETSPFSLQRELRDWKQPQLKRGRKAGNTPRRAGISCFGAGGTNVHLILEEYIAPQVFSNTSAADYVKREESLIILSAEQPEVLDEYLQRLSSYIKENTDHTGINLQDMEYTLQIGREAMKERIAFIAYSPEDLSAKIDRYLKSENTEIEVFRGTAASKVRVAVSAEQMKEASLAELAAHWVRGAVIEWRQLYKDSKRMRISLPTYPFLRQSYWLKHHNETEPHIKADAGTNTTFQSQESRTKQQVVSCLKELLAEELGVSYKALDETEMIWNYGLDSLSIKKLNAQIKKKFGKIPSTVFFDCQTISELADYLMENCNNEKICAIDIDSNQKEPESYISCSNQEQTAVRTYKKSVSIQEDKYDTTAIAIIGISGRYPMADNISELWENIKSGRDCITGIPEERLDYWQQFGIESSMNKSSYAQWGGFIKDFDKFDPLFFNITPREAELMDPQERLFLQTVWEAIEDAGYAGQGLGSVSGWENAPVGVFVGAMWSEYQIFGVTEALKGNLISPSSALWSIPNRVSYFFNFSGPSMSVDSACSSSLTAIHLACESLKRNECAVAVAGGVSLSMHPVKYVYLNQRKFASSDGKCRSFGEGGDGYVPGEGVGAVILKPLSQAVKDGDHIYGVIRGSGVSHGGRANGYTVPNPKAQADLIRNVLNKARVNPRDVGYIEAHGTGTALGDPIEVEGLTKAFRTGTPENQFCSIGSVKSNIGHCESAAGIAGLTKVLLQMKYGQLIPSLHSKVLNPNIDFIDTPFKVQQELAEWKRPVAMNNGQLRECPRIAGISSFGAGGSNGHILVEEYIQEPDRNNWVGDIQQHPVIILLSARSSEQLHEQARRLLAAVRQKQFSDSELVSVAYTLQVGREAMEERLAMIVDSVGDLERKLGDFLSGRGNATDICCGQIKSSKEAMSVFTVDEELKEAIDKWIQKGKYWRLLEFWVKGLAIDWNKLYGDKRPMRVSLPTYPFAGERYWIPGSAMRCEAEISGLQVEEGHQAKRKLCLLEKNWELCTAAPTKNFYKTVAILTKSETEGLASQLSQYFSSSRIFNIAELESQIGQPEAVWKEYDGCIDLTGCGSVKTGLSVWIEWHQKLIEYGHKDGMMLLCVSNGLESYRNNRVDLTGAVNAGLYRMLQSEYGHLSSRHMDSDLEIGDKALAEQIACEFLMDCEESEVCYRDGKRYRAFLKETDESIKKHEALKFPEGHVLWITGGTRGLGHLCAKHFVTNYGVKRLVLTGRESIPPKEQWSSLKRQNTSIAQKIKAIEDLEMLGAQVHTVSVSLTDGNALRDVLTEVENTMGKIGGVIHCAGITDAENPAFIRKSVTSVERVLEPKVYGLDKLYEVFSDRPLKFFVLFSSVSAIIPTLATGQSDYAMGNAYMDYFAEAKVNSYPVISIQWPSWKETGFGEVKNRAYLQTGLLSHTDTEGLQLLDWILSANTSAVVLPAVVNPDLWKPHCLMQRRIEGNMQKPGMAAGRVEKGPAKSSGTLLQTIQRWLAEVFSNELKLPPEKLDMDRTFQDYGIDSILMAQLTNTISKLAADSLDPSIMYEYSNITALSAWLENTYAAEISKALEIPGQESHDSNTRNSTTIEQVFPEAQATDGENSRIRREPGTQDIAVIGLSCRFPGAENLDEYWNLLSEGRSAISSVPDERWGYAADCFAALIDYNLYFDPKSFLISEEDVRAMDPQALIMLEESFKAWHHAGYGPNEIKGKSIGVYIGARSQHWPDEISFGRTRNPIVAVGQNYLAANISHFFDLRGPSVVVDTACSSALTGMNMAIQGLLLGETECAIVGGVSLLNTDRAFRIFKKRGILSREPYYHVFDKRANGVVLGEGAGVVLLKTLNRALEDGDRIYAVIKGLAINNDGRTAGPAAPNIQAQKAVLQSALAKSGKKPEEISYIEANGSGSEVTDLLELKVIQAIYNSPGRSPLGIGCIKPNIGHPLSAEGIASFIKVVLMLHYGELAPFLSGDQPMPHYDFKSSPFCFYKKHIKWPNSSKVAAVNCFADGGTNAHVIVEAWDNQSLYHIKRRPLPLQEWKGSSIRPTGIAASSVTIEGDNFITSYEKQGNPVHNNVPFNENQKSDKKINAWKKKIVEV